MLRFFCCWSRIQQLNGLHENLREVDPEVRLYITKENKSLGLAYNRLATKSKPTRKEEILCFIHQDCRLYFDFKTIIPIYFQRLYKAGVIGFVGTNKLSLSEPRWYFCGRRYGGLIQGEFPGNFETNLNFDACRGILPGAHLKFEPIDSVDGYCMFVRREVFDEIGGFDTQFDWHLYDADLCMSAMKAGYQNYVVDQKSCHFSPGDFKVDWKPYFEKFRAKWGAWINETGRK